jgi:hypothetical protein
MGHPGSWGTRSRGALALTAGAIPDLLAECILCG